MNLKYFFLFFLFVANLYPQDKLAFEGIFTGFDNYPHLGTDAIWFDNGNKFSYSLPDGDNSESSIYYYDVLTRQQQKFLSISELRDLSGDDSFEPDNYTWSPKNNYILFTGTTTARSLKTAGDFRVFDVKNKKFILHINSGKEQLNIKFSPDESKIGFVRDNNLFVVDIKSGKETQITNDGNNLILNGVFDWVYEEEFSIIEAWSWSPDSKKIAFWRLDQTNVPQFPIVQYEGHYNHVTWQHYPKVGAPVSEVKIGVADLLKNNTVWMDINAEDDFYIPRMTFTNDPGIIAIQRLNRLQNKLELLFADALTGKTKVIITEQEEHWVDVWDHLTFLKQSNKFIWTSERDGYLHFYLYDYDGNIINQITKGSFEVDKLLFTDEENESIYFTSTERSPLQRDLYSISFDGSGKKRITDSAGTHVINFSPNGKYFIDEYSSASKPHAYYLYSYTGKNISTIYESEERSIIPPVEFFSFTASDGVELNAFMVKPPDFNPSNKYPVMIFNYSGPGSQSVEDKWQAFSYNIYRYFAGEGYVVLTVDNRGTGGRGKEFEHIVYKNLGKWELNDIIEGIKYLNRKGFIDTSRVGITGTSYGGFISALAVMKHPEYFKVGIAVSSVLDWRLYDAIYTERFMQTDELNPEGYEESSILNYASKLKNKLLIMHGTSDDNVHFQNSVALVDELVNNNKSFDLMIYPGTKHGPFKLHYYYMLRDYIINNL